VEDYNEVQELEIFPPSTHASLILSVNSDCLKNAPASPRAAYEDNRLRYYGPLRTLPAGTRAHHASSIVYRYRWPRAERNVTIGDWTNGIFPTLLTAGSVLCVFSFLQSSVATFATVPARERLRAGSRFVSECPRIWALTLFAIGDNWPALRP
jgi:hypothetical protein